MRNLGMLVMLGVIITMLVVSVNATASRQVELKDMFYVHEIKKDGTPLHTGETVKVRGIVVVPPGIFYKSIYIYDPGENKGVDVFGADLTSVVNLGDYVEITGTIDHYNGETEIKITSSSDVSVISTGNSFRAERIYTDNAYNEVYEGSFVEVCGKVEKVNYTYSYFYLNDSSGSIEVYAKNLNINWIHEGMNLSVTGVVSQYDRSSPYFSYYEIKPRFQNDIKNISSMNVQATRYPLVPNENEPVNVYANISSATEVYLNYTTDNWSSYNRIAMNYNSSANKWEATIPGTSKGTLIRYVIEAKDSSGLWNYSVEYKYYVGSVGIKIARKAPQYAWLKVYGNITARPGDFSSTNAYIQNGSYGIKVTSNNFPTLNYADYIMAKGYVIHQRQNDVYVVGKEIQKIATGTPISPIYMSVAEANTTNNGSLIEVEGVVVAVDSSGFNISDSQGNVLRIYNASQSNLSWIAVGKHVIVIGIQSQYYETHEVMIRGEGDVQEVVEEFDIYISMLALIAAVIVYAKK